MSEILVDSNVILDVLKEDPQWFEWSAQMLADYADQGELVINPIIYAEISIGFNQPEEVEAALPEDFFRRDPLPYSAAFQAGQSFLEYRRRGGERRYQLLDVGWENLKRIYNCFIHLDIKDGKIWIQRNMTEADLAQELM